MPKVLLVGPKGVGKTTVANYLSEHRDTFGAKVPPRYQPTIGTRILEVEKSAANSRRSVPIELWDVSGDQRFEACWPAIMKDADGIVIMYDPENPGHERDVILWYDYFVANAGLDDSQCMVLAHRSGGQTSGGRTRISPKLSKVMLVDSSFQDGSAIDRGFENFLSQLSSSNNGNGK